MYAEYARKLHNRCQEKEPSKLREKRSGTSGSQRPGNQNKELRNKVLRSVLRKFYEEEGSYGQNESIKKIERRLVARRGLHMVKDDGYLRLVFIEIN